jgi:transaldolase/glucose-6-phosphate isomerase
MTTPPVAVQAFGQSLWYDNIRRDLLTQGEIARLIAEDGVMGITSNPTIFMKAIGASRHYDASILKMLDEDPYTIYEHLALEDIRAAADLLLPVYERTDKRDGYVSLEVSPLLAEDTEQTLSEAKRLFAALDRPNAMIKIPATPAGLPAIEAAIAEGININVTLIFSVSNYQDVAEAYIKGLERRLAAGLSVAGIASVASFFISRIDAVVDQQLENNIRVAQGRDLDRVRQNAQLQGTVAIANAKMAYRAFRSLFYGERFAALKAAGAMVQRPLWASTGTKNPNYPPTLYVDSLIGPDTVNTVPPETLAAFKREGKVAATLEQDLDKSPQVLEQLAEVGIDLEHINRILQQDGVDAFSDSFRKLLRTVEGKREMLRAGVMERQRLLLSGYEPLVKRALDRLEDNKANAAIWGKEARFWKEAAIHHASIRNRLGWLTCLTDGTIDRQRLVALREEARQWTHAVVLGMGGSSLAPEVFSLTFGQQAGFPQLLVLDSTDPAAVQAVQDSVKLETTVFVVASKSGSTIETDAFRRYFYEVMRQTIGADRAGQHFIAITDAGTKMEALAKEGAYRHIFINPTDIGGRYSALSYFGLVPAALMGLDLAKLLASAERMNQAIAPIIPARGHPGMWLGAAMATLAQKGYDKLMLVCSPQIASFANWVEQLVAESTGKEGVGILPIAGATIGKPHDYADDRFIVYLRLDEADAEQDAALQALWEAGHPVCILNLRDAYDLGGEFLRWEFATAVAGHLLGINPFDEPNVTESKNNTSRLLEVYARQGQLPLSEPYLTEDDVELHIDPHTAEILNTLCEQRNFGVTSLTSLLAAYIGFARSGDYIALMAYLHPTPAYDEQIQNIRRRLRHVTHLAVTVGYGPRFLHSTGQLHKGGPAKGHFLQITVDDPHDLPIPGFDFSFGTLKQAQAGGDQQALMSRERPFIRLHIKGDIMRGLSKITDAIRAAEAKQL